MAICFSAQRLFCTNRDLSALPFPGTDLCYGGLRDGYAKSGVAVEHRDADLERGNLPVEVSGDEASAKEFDAVHLCLCAAAAVISSELLPE